MGNCEQMSENLGRNGECEGKGDWRAALLWELTHKVVKEEGNKKERWGNGKAMRAEGPGRGKATGRTHSFTSCRRMAEQPPHAYLALRVWAAHSDAFALLTGSCAISLSWT